MIEPILNMRDSGIFNTSRKMKLDIIRKINQYFIKI